jgi:hypothetical protein
MKYVDTVDKSEDTRSSLKSKLMESRRLCSSSQMFDLPIEGMGKYQDEPYLWHIHSLDNNQYQVIWSYGLSLEAFRIVQSWTFSASPEDEVNGFTGTARAFSQVRSALH